MRFEFDGRPYRLGFQYDKPSRTTVAFVSQGRRALDGGMVWDPMVAANSQCSPKDRFDRKVGRLVALKRLLANPTLTRAFRVAMGQAFRRACKLPLLMGV